MKSQEESLKQISDLIDEGYKRLQGRRENAILILGSTGMGKSTTTNFLSDQELHGKMDGFGDMIITKLDTTIQPRISEESCKSETRIPNEVIKTLQDGQQISIFDNPGFMDTEGIEQEIANSFYIIKLLDMIDKVKFVFVAADHTFKGPALGFCRSMKNLVSMFTDVGFLENSISLVVTQVQKNKTKEMI